LPSCEGEHLLEPVVALAVVNLERAERRVFREEGWKIAQCAAEREEVAALYLLDAVQLCGDGCLGDFEGIAGLQSQQALSERVIGSEFAAFDDGVRQRLDDPVYDLPGGLVPEHDAAPRSDRLRARHEALVRPSVYHQADRVAEVHLGPAVSVTQGAVAELQRPWVAPDVLVDDAGKRHELASRSVDVDRDLFQPRQHLVPKAESHQDLHPRESGLQRVLGN
jgi:hypothetical protein